MSDEEANVKVSIQITRRMSARQSKCLRNRQSGAKEKMLTVNQAGNSIERPSNVLYRVCMPRQI